jgi:enterobactin synthetase component D
VNRLKLVYRAAMNLSAEDVRRALPFPVGIGIRRGVDGGLPALFALEEGCLGPNTAQRRRFFFMLGRAAARDALGELGVASVAIGCGAGGEPLWPAHIVGAISHTGDLAIAIVGRQTDYAGLGVDIERLSPGLSARAARLVCTPSELAWIGDGVDGEQEGTRRRTMLFSAKEAVFKATYPIERVWLGFSDAELTWHAEQSAFEARLRKQVSAVHPVGAVLQVPCTLTEAEVLSTTFATRGAFATSK